MVPKVWFGWVLSASAIVLGCGETSTNPTAPTAQIRALPPADAIREVRISGDQWIWTTSPPIQMTARLITGSQPEDFFPMTVGMRWSVDPAGVVAVDQNGVATVVASGTAIVTARLADKVGSLPIRVLPNFAGVWTGTYRNTSCSGLTPDVRTCFNNTIGAVGMTLTVTQINDQVSGTLADLNSVRLTPLTGSVSTSGVLTLAGSVKESPLVEARRIEDWSSRVMADGTQSGSFVSHGYLLDLLGRDRSASGERYELILRGEFSGLVRAR